MRPFRKWSGNQAGGRTGCPVMQGSSLKRKGDTTGKLGKLDCRNIGVCSSSNIIPQIAYQNRVFDTDKHKAEAFNNYFCSVHTDENMSMLPQIASQLMPNTDSITTVSFTADDVYAGLCKIDSRKSSGPDAIPGRLLKEAAPVIDESLAQLFTRSLRTGEIPTDWITAHVTPIHKRGERRLPQNYRPISLTSLVVKVMERLIANQLNAFLLADNILSPAQHGFRAKHSCLTQLLETTHEWAQTLNRALSTHIVFIDFAKAFDSVPHERLLLKLEEVGVRGDLLLWIRGFLVGRTQRVVINGYKSSWKRTRSGVPQGSVLGPLLFIIYINDISANLDSKISLFADDCAIYREVSDLSDCSVLQHDLNTISSWTNKWQLKLNTDKCKVMQITNKRNPIIFPYTLGTHGLEWVDSYTYLGVTYNGKLSWTAQCQQAAAKANMMLGLLKRVMKGSHTQAKVRAYRSIVRPHLEYCVQAWSPHYQKNIEILESVQRRAARWMAGSVWSQNSMKWSKSYEQCLTELNLPSLRARRLFLLNLQTYKIVHSLDCINFQKYYRFCNNLSSRSYHPLHICLLPSRVNTFRYSFFVNAPFIWNQLPGYLLCVVCPETFRDCLASHLYPN